MKPLTYLVDKKSQPVSVQFDNVGMRPLEVRVNPDDIELLYRYLIAQNVEMATRKLDSYKDEEMPSVAKIVHDDYLPHGHAMVRLSNDDVLDWTFEVERPKVAPEVRAVLTPEEADGEASFASNMNALSPDAFADEPAKDPEEMAKEAFLKGSTPRPGEVVTEPEKPKGKGKK
jgi:hypothetical protein